MSNRLLLSALTGLSLAAAGCATTSAEQRPAETAGAYLDDAAVTTAVKAAVLGDPDAHLFKVEVTTTQGHVLLEGAVNSRVTEGRLMDKVRALRGVRSVKSLLRLDGRSS